MYDLVEKNELGFYSLKKKPTDSELGDYYANKYYQNQEHGYQHSYSSKELSYIVNKIEQKHNNILSLELLSSEKTYRLLDVGCGEGFTLKYFKNLGWDVTGLDYSSFGCKQINPDCEAHLIKGDIEKNIQKLRNNKEQFDLIWLDNVLEHLLDPLKLLVKLKSLTTSSGVLVIEVPNDFSIVQKQLFASGHIDAPFWVVSPDHISYFNKDGLARLCAEAGWKHEETIGDFPIDFFLFNQSSNYKKMPETGKSAHQARVEIENLLAEMPFDRINQFYKAMADLGIGRQLIGFFKNNG